MYFSFGEERVLLLLKLYLYLAFNRTENLMLSRMGHVFKNFSSFLNRDVQEIVLKSSSVRPS